MSQPHEQHGQPGAEPSRNPFVRFQKGFERRFDRFREGYGALLEQVIAHQQRELRVGQAIGCRECRHTILEMPRRIEYKPYAHRRWREPFDQIANTVGLVAQHDLERLDTRFGRRIDGS